MEVFFYLVYKLKNTFAALGYGRQPPVSRIFALKGVSDIPGANWGWRKPSDMFNQKLSSTPEATAIHKFTAPDLRDAAIDKLHQCLNLLLQFQPFLFKASVLLTALTMFG